MYEEEPVFDPPHGKEVFDVLYDGCVLSFRLESGRNITMNGSMRFHSTRYAEDNDIPISCSGCFIGDLPIDDFVYPVEVHFADTYGRIYERPRPLPECLCPIDITTSYAQFVDPAGRGVTCIREYDLPWSPANGNLFGRVGHLLFFF